MDTTTIAIIVIGSFVALLALGTVLGSFFTIQTQQAAVIQRFGKFLRLRMRG